MDAEADLSPRILHLIRQAQVVDKVLRGAQRAGTEVTERVATIMRSGMVLLGYVNALSCD